MTIAVNNPDNLVNDNYYEAGKGINRSLDRELLAQTLLLRASVHLDDVTGEVDLRLSGNSQPKTLELNLISPIFGCVYLKTLYGNYCNWQKQSRLTLNTPTPMPAALRKAKPNRNCWAQP